VIYDTPPLVAVTDGVIIGGMVAGLVLAISSAKTTKKLAQRVREQLENVGVPVFGVILNNVKASHGYYYYSSYYRYYGEDSDRSE
jgi:Mrp family chromosome partitioning ATPase